LIAAAAALLAAAAPVAIAGESPQGLLEVKVVECPALAFEAVRESGAGALPGELTGPQVSMLWKNVSDKKARVVLSAELSAMPGGRSEWRSGKVLRYLGGYGLCGRGLVTVPGEMPLGWVVSLRAVSVPGGLCEVHADVAYSALRGDPGSIETPHGPVETPAALVRSISTTARMSAHGVSVLGLIPVEGGAAAKGAGASGPLVYVVLLRADLPDVRAEPTPVLLEAPARLISPPLVPPGQGPRKASFVSAKVISMPDEMLDGLRSGTSESAGGSTLTAAQLSAIAEAVRSGRAEILSASAVNTVSGFAEVLSGERRSLVTGYDSADIDLDADEEKPDRPAAVVLPRIEQVFSGFSLALRGRRDVIPLAEEKAEHEHTADCGCFPAGPAIECSSELKPMEVKALDSKLGGKVQTYAVSAARVEAPLDPGRSGAYLLGGSTGESEKPGMKRVVLVEITAGK